GGGGGHALVRLMVTVPFSWICLPLPAVDRSAAAGRLASVERPRRRGALAGARSGAGFAPGLTRANLTERDCSSGGPGIFGQFSSAASTGVRDEELVERFGW